MSPEDIKPEWVEKAAREITDYLHGNSAWIPPQHWQIARNVLAAVLPEAMAEAWDEGKEALAAALLPDAAPLINPYREGSES